MDGRRLSEGRLRQNLDIIIIVYITFIIDKSSFESYQLHENLQNKHDLARPSRGHIQLNPEYTMKQ
jgi:hypothetical protein